MRYHIAIILLIYCGFSFQACISSNVYLKEENDFFTTGGRSDQNYSQGLEVGVVLEDVDFPPIEDFDYHGLQVGIKHQIYTPDDLREPELIKDQNPYAGLFQGEATHFTLNASEMRQSKIGLGVIGPSAQGEAVQRWFHDIIRSTDPQGWDNQLRDEPVVQIEHGRIYLNSIGEFLGPLSWDAHSRFMGRLGTIHTDFSVGQQIRVGHNLNRFNLATVGLSYYGFLDAAMTGVARNAFFDGNLYKESHSVQKEYLVFQGITGVGVGFHKWNIEFQLIGRSPDYEEQPGGLHTYGRLVFTRLFGGRN